MPVLRCPHCDERFSVNEQEGPRVECPSCSTRFERAPSGAESTRSGPSITADTSALPLLLRGALLQILSLLLVVVAVGLVGLVVLARIDRPGMDDISRFFVAVMFLCLFASWCLDLVAASCWAMAPTRGVSRGLAVALLCFCALALLRAGDVVHAIDGPGRFDNGPFRSGEAFVAVLYFIQVARLTVLAAYLASVAHDTGRTSAASMATVQAIATPILLLGPFGLAILAGLFNMGSADIGIAVMMLSSLCAFAVFFWTFLTILGLRNAWQRMARSSHED